MELTDQDREEIQNQIVEYKTQTLVNKPVINLVPPTAPNGEQTNKALDDAIANEAAPDKKEARRVKKKVRGLWRSYRTAALDAKSLEIEKIACQIEIERKETQAKLNEIKRQEEKAAVEHWLNLNKGNLEEVDMNINSKPSKFWYNFRRGFHHITKLTTNIPKIIKNLFWIGVLIVGLVLLKHFNVL